MKRKVSYFLKSAPTKYRERLIILQVKYNPHKLIYTFDEHVKKTDWNKTKQRVIISEKTKSKADNLEAERINTKLDDIANEINQKIKIEYPEPAILQDHLNRFLKRKVSSHSDNAFWAIIDRFQNGEVKDRLTLKDKTTGTLATYGVVKSRLEKFEKDSKYILNFETINQTFFEKFVHWMRKEQFAENTIHKTIKILKVFLKRAVAERLTFNSDFLQFHIPSVEAEDISLSRDEIDQLFKFDFSDNKRLQQVRDLFVFGCSTGLRISDFSDVQPENIVTIKGRKHIRIITKKTGTLVEIPCNDDVLKIFVKYAKQPNHLPPAISDVKFNKYIKEAAKEAGLTETGRIASDPSKKLYELISSRTCRKSLCTNLYLENFPIASIMMISGHKSESSFLKYIRVTRTQASDAFTAHEDKRIKDKKKNGKKRS